MGVAPDPPVFWGWTDWHGMSLPCTCASSPPLPWPQARRQAVSLIYVQENAHDQERQRCIRPV